jgi:hypothetical protein
MPRSRRARRVEGCDGKKEKRRPGSKSHHCGTHKSERRGHGTHASDEKVTEKKERKSGERKATSIQPIPLSGFRMSTLATDNAINMDSFRADAYSFVQDYEKLLLERNALKFDLETAKNSSLKDEARYVLLKKENVHLKEELDSSLTHIDQNIQNIVCHFKAKDELDRMRSEIKGLHDLVYEKTNANSGLLSQLHALKTEMDRAEAIHLSDCSAHEK